MPPQMKELRMSYNLVILELFLTTLNLQPNRDNYTLLCAPPFNKHLHSFKNRNKTARAPCQVQMYRIKCRATMNADKINILTNKQVRLYPKSACAKKRSFINNFLVARCEIVRKMSFTVFLQLHKRLLIFMGRDVAQCIPNCYRMEQKKATIEEYENILAQWNGVSEVNLQSSDVQCGYRTSGFSVYFGHHDFRTNSSKSKTRTIKAALPWCCVCLAIGKLCYQK